MFKIHMEDIGIKWLLKQLKYEYIKNSSPSGRKVTLINNHLESTGVVGT